MNSVIRRRAFACVLMFSLPSFGAIIGTQTDNFETGVQNWTNGAPAPDPTTVGGGPGGASDHFLQITADGAGSAGRLTVFNRAQWTGDFSNIISISMDLLDPNTFPLNVRIALKSSTAMGGPGIVSNPFFLAADDVWHHAIFNITAANFTGVNGGTFASVIPNVVEFRLLNSTGTSLNGDLVVGMLGVDNITATAAPEPTAFLLLGGGLALLALMKRPK